MATNTSHWNQSNATLNAPHREDDISSSFVSEGTEVLDEVVILKQPDPLKQPIVDVKPVTPSSRIDWIDGFKGIACTMVFFAHYADNTYAEFRPDITKWGSPQQYIRSGSFALNLFYLLSARVLVLGFLKKRNGQLNYKSLGSSFFRRIFRFAIPTAFTLLFQYLACVIDIFGYIPQAKLILKNNLINKPGWCELKSPFDQYKLMIQMFSDNDHLGKLYYSSTMWTIYDQYWGSVFVYGLVILVAKMNNWRFAIYAIVAAGCSMSQSPNLIFLCGFVISDLDTAELIKKFEKLSIYIVLGFEFLVAFIVLFMMCGGKITENFDRTYNTITLRNGVAGTFFDLWPNLMRLSFLIISLGIMILCELCNPIKFVLRFRVLKYLGKIGFGLYCLHQTFIYAIMPPCVIFFNNLGIGYVNNLILSGIVTFVTCAICSDLIFVRYIEELGIQMGNVGWKALSTGQDTSFLMLIWETLKYIVLAIVLLPFGILKWLWNGIIGFPSAFRSFGQKCKNVYNWRDVAVRENKGQVVFSQVDAMLMGLHSTDWKEDVLTDPKSSDTIRVQNFHKYAWFLHVIAIVSMWLLWYRFNPLGKITFEWLNFNVLYRGLWLLLIPYCVITMAGFFTPYLPLTKEAAAKKPVKRGYIRKFYIALVTKGSNDEAVRRGYDALVHLNAMHPSVEVVVISDEPYHYPDLNNVVCPIDFQSANGKSKYKARALEYFRIQANLNEFDWILHLDEESVIDAESLRRCFDFIRYTDHHLGQGVILYNGYQYWKNWFFTVADAIRVGDDLARFHLQYTVFKRPVFGVHGSFLLTNGELENEVTWGFGSLAEDFEFSHAAWEKGFTVGGVHGIVREQSPMTIIDFMKQRRRWYLGICQIQGIHALPAIAIKLWTAGIICLAITILNIPFSFTLDDSPTVFWVSFLAALCYANIYWVYVYGMIFQDIDYGYPWYIVLLHIPVVVILQPVVSILEAAAIVWAMMDDKVEFEVIKK